MNNLYNIINTIKHITLEHPLVMRFTEGDVYTNLNEDKDKKYPAINLDIDNINIGANYQTVNGNLFYIDRLLTDESNRTEVQAVGMRTLQSIINKLAETYNWNWTSQVYNIFTEKFADLCAGVYVTFTMEVPAEEICADDVFEPAVITITNNGEYDVAPYDKAIIDVKTYITSTGVVVSEPFSFLEYVCKQGAYPFTEIDDDSVTVINRPNAFYSQKQLLNVRMSALGTISGGNVFYSCSALQEVNMPKLTTISSGSTFRYCSALQNVILPNLTTISGGYTFRDCSALQNVTLPSLATISGNGTFQNCSALQNVTFGTLTAMNEPFYNAKLNLRNITIGQDTDINLDFHYWSATNVIKEGKSGITELNSNLYNNLLTKLYDHSQDGVRRTLSLGWLAKVTAENIAYANAKGWTLTKK